MSKFEFKKAVRSHARLRMAVCGPSGAGKTYSSLLIASGLGGKICVIDTERGSASLYAGLVEYDVLELEPPYRPRRYCEAIRAAEDAGYDVIVIDSLSHAWTGEGGALEQHDLAAAKTKNSFAAWREITPEHNALVDCMLTSRAHIIATMRSKTAYEVVDGKVKKLGLEPVQRAGLEYEFTLVFDVDKERHVACASKDRTSLFDAENFTPSKKTGEQLSAWLGGAEAQKEAVRETLNPKPVEKPPAKNAERAGRFEKLPPIGLEHDGQPVGGTNSEALMIYMVKLDGMSKDEAVDAKKRSACAEWVTFLEGELDKRVAEGK